MGKRHNGHRIYCLSCLYYLFCPFVHFIHLKWVSQVSGYQNDLKTIQNSCYHFDLFFFGYDNYQLKLLEIAIFVCDIFT